MGTSGPKIGTGLSEKKLKINGHSIHALAGGMVMNSHI